MRKKMLRPIRIEDQDETGASFVFQVSRKTAMKFQDPGQWAFATFTGKVWELEIGCRPETLANIIFDEFNRVGLNDGDFEDKEFSND